MQRSHETPLRKTETNKTERPKHMKTEILQNDPSTILSPLARFSERLERDNGQILPGQVCLANESRFSAAYFSEPLTAYATGWKEPNNIEALLDFVAPPVQVAG